MKKNVFSCEATLDNIDILVGGIEQAVLDACGKDVNMRQGVYRINVVWCSPDDCDCIGYYHKESCPHYVETL
jgi:hypothetical protein